MGLWTSADKGKAAQVRDQLHLLKEQLFGAPGADNVVSITGQ